METPASLLSSFDIDTMSSRELRDQLLMSHFLNELSDTEPFPQEGEKYDISPLINREHAQPYERRSDQPLRRPLRVYTMDPSSSLIEGAMTTVNVPYEPLEPGPIGALIQVEETLPPGHHNGQANLDDPKMLMESGYAPSPSRIEFHQQMVYAVCCRTYEVFQIALGRYLDWGFQGVLGNNQAVKLRVLPHGQDEHSAFYDPISGRLNFGYFKAKSEEVSGRNLPGGPVFTCLSHDIITHEMTHALLDGLRSSFNVAGTLQTPAFHEAFADLVAIFQRFCYKDVVSAAIAKCRGKLEQAALITNIASQFGQTTGKNGPLRTAIDLADPPLRLDKAADEEHALGSVLVSAVFEAFNTIFQRKTEPLFRLATNGTGVLPEGALPRDLQDLLAGQAAKLASHFLNICIRAIDYCPPVDIEFGDYLRAVISADYDLYPEDPWHYREAWIDAFQRRGIFPRHVDHLTEDNLRWESPQRELPRIPALDFAHLRFAGSPARPAGRKELRRQACALGWFITHSDEWLDDFGCVRPDDPRVCYDDVERPRIESIRTSQRVGENGQVVFDLIAEVTQRRTVRNSYGLKSFKHSGGSTVLIDPQGSIRYMIVKRIMSEERVIRQQQFINSPQGEPYWVNDGVNLLAPDSNFFRRLHSIGKEASNK